MLQRPQRFLRYRSHLSDHDTELAVITAAREMDCDYVWSGRSQGALRAGVRPEAVDIVANLGSLDGLTEQEAVIVRFGREVVGDHKLSQEAFDAAAAQFSEGNTVAGGSHGPLYDDELHLDSYRHQTGRRGARSAQGSVDEHHRLGWTRYHMTPPPELISCPVILRASSEAKNTAMVAASSGPAPLSA
jgi:hypothetical protein